MKKCIFLVLSLALLVLGSRVPMAEEQQLFKIITNSDNPVTSLSKTQLSKILLKKVSKWETGDPVRAVDQGGKQAVREVFSKAIHGRSASSIQRYWQRQIFSGKGVPPPELESDREVLDFVAQNAGSLGYVSIDAPVDGVKILEITE